MIRVASVQYLNSLPFNRALDSLSKQQALEWLDAIPSECAKLLRQREVDVALLPVGALADFDSLAVVSHFCIGSEGAVRTVKLFSHVPFEEVQTVFFSKDSRTSNVLAQILAEHYFHLNALNWVQEGQCTEDEKVGRIIIGDEAFSAERLYPYQIDLGQAWYEMTGYPFVFALWVAINHPGIDIERKINDAFQEEIDRVLMMDEFHYGGISDKDLRNYFRMNISYVLDVEKRKAMDLFLSLSGIKNPLI